MLKKILFFGNERLATGVSTDAPVLRALLDADYEIAALVVAQKEAGPSRKGRGLEIAEVAEAHSVPVVSPTNLTAAKAELSAYEAHAAVLVAYGKIVPQAVIDIFPAGIINIHPSLLPKHRGPTPVESVILNGETETGVSLMALSAKMDAGPVYAQQTVGLSGQETKPGLVNKLTEIGKDMLLEKLPLILEGSLAPIPQDDGRATFDTQIVKTDGLMSFSKPAVQLEREVRAYAGWPRSRTRIDTFDVIITKAHVAEGAGTPGKISIDDNRLGVYTRDGLLIIDALIPIGKKEMPAAAFLAGYRLN